MMDILRELLAGSSPSTSLCVALLKASLILMVAQLIVSASPRLSAAMKHFLLTAGIASFLLLPLLSLFGPAWSVAVLPSIERPAPDGPPPDPAHLIRAVAPSTETARPLTIADAEPATRFGLLQISAFLWSVGFIAILGRFLLSAIRLGTIVRHARPASERLDALLAVAARDCGAHGPIRLLRSDRIRVPMVWGFRKGTLLLPAAAESWSDEQLHATFIHELGHLRRLDYVSLAMMNLVSAILWFDPQLWIARRRALIEGERACDDLVLRSGARPSDYAALLLHVARLARPREPLGVLLAMARPSQLEDRMRAILSPSTNRQSIERKVLMTSIATFLGIIVPFAALQLTAQTSPAPPAPPKPAMAATAAAPLPAVVASPAAKPIPATPTVAPKAVTPPLDPITPLAAAPLPIAVTPEPPGALTPLAVAPVPMVATPEPPSSLTPLAMAPVPIAARPVPAAAPRSTAPAPMAAPLAPPAEPSTRAIMTPAPDSVTPTAPAPAARPRSERGTAPAPKPPSSGGGTSETPVPTSHAASTIPILSIDEAEARPHRLLGSVKGRTCTPKLNRPVNTGDPASNPAEVLATQRLLTSAVKKGADAVTGFKCMREIFIGFACPTAVVCSGNAIALEPSATTPPERASLAF